MISHMSGASDGLRVVRRVGGTVEWNGKPLGVPGEDGAVLLVEVDAAAVTGAAGFEMTPMGEWLGTVAGIRYQIMPGVVVETGDFVFLGVAVEPWKG